MGRKLEDVQRPSALRSLRHSADLVVSNWFLEKFADSTETPASHKLGGGCAEMSGDALPWDTKSYLKDPSPAYLHFEV